MGLELEYLRGFRPNIRVEAISFFELCNISALNFTRMYKTLNIEYIFITLFLYSTLGYLSLILTLLSFTSIYLIFIWIEAAILQWPFIQNLLVHLVDL